MPQSIDRFLPAFLNGAIAQDEHHRRRCERTRILWANEDDWPGEPN